MGRKSKKNTAICQRLAIKKDIFLITRESKLKEWTSRGKTISDLTVNCLIQFLNQMMMVQVLDTVGQDVNVAFLRPLSTPPSVLESHQIRESPGAEFETNRIFHPGKVQELCNSAFRCHSIHKPACQGELHWDDDGEIQRGLGWRERLKCSICDYVSSRHNLYSEVQSAKPGVKTVGLNIGVQVGQTHTSISNSGLNALLLAMNIPSPSFS